MHPALGIRYIRRVFVQQATSNPHLCLFFCLEGYPFSFFLWSLLKSSQQVFLFLVFRHMNPLLIPNPIHLVHLQVDQAPKWTFSAHNDSFLPQAFMTLSLPGSFLRYRESLLSWELKDPIGTTLNQRRMGVGGIVLQLSHHLVGQFWSLSYTVPQRVPKGIEAQMPTVVNHRLMLLLLTFLPSLSHFPHSFTCASWKHLPNTLPGPKLLEKGLLWGETQPAQPLLFKDLTFLQNSHGRSYILTFLDSFVVRIYNIGSNNQVSLWEFITQRSRACASSISS